VQSGIHRSPCVNSIIIETLVITVSFLEKRTTEAAKIIEKFQERIPVIIEKSSTEQKLPELDQQK
jgi:hypothetical protein